MGIGGQQRALHAENAEQRDARLTVAGFAQPPQKPGATLNVYMPVVEGL